MSEEHAKVEIDWKKADELMISGCPGTEIAGYFGIHPNTLYNRVQDKYGCGFSDYLHQKRSKGDALLRARQYEKALKNGDNMMLIWLGKNRLGQKDSSDFKMEASLTVQTINYSEANVNNAPVQVPAETLPTANPSSS